jgi:hypothetical protein
MHTGISAYFNKKLTLFRPGTLCTIKQNINLSPLSDSTMEDTTFTVSWCIDRRPGTDIQYGAENYNCGVIFIRERVEIADEQYECCVCMENREKEEVCALNCNHTFCAMCVKTIMTASRAFCCPICRGKVTRVTSCSSIL